MTEVATRAEPGGDLDAYVDPTNELIAWAASAQQAYQIAVRLAETSFVPVAMRRRPDEITGAILAGRELGLSPMSALRSIDIIDGTPSMRAHALRGLVQAHGHRIWVEESTDTRAIVCGQRRVPIIEAGSSHIERSVWTIDRAKKANLTNKKNWQNYPGAMLIARATAEVCRLIAADVLLGMPYATEELSDGVDADTAPAQAGEKRRPAAKRTAQRAARPAPPDSAESEPALDPLDGVPDEPRSVAEDTREPAEEMITGPQTRKLHAAFNDAGITERESRLTIASGLIGRQVGSSTELTKREASVVIDALEKGYGRGQDLQDPDDEPIDAEVEWPDAEPIP